MGLKDRLRLQEQVNQLHKDNQQLYFTLSSIRQDIMKSLIAPERGQAIKNLDDWRKEFDKAKQEDNDDTQEG